jgi:hypothetical protein
VAGIIGTTAFISVAAANVALAQATGNQSPEEEAICPPDIKGEPLSDKLAQSKGVICRRPGLTGTAESKRGYGS